MKLAGWFGLGLAFIISVMFGAGAQAATRGVGVSPAYQQIELAPTQAEARFTLELTNNSGVDQSYALSTTDFGSLNEEGGVAFLGDSATGIGSKYGLASWMSLAVDQVFIRDGDSVQVEVTVTNRDSLTPGGHYGAVLATATTDAKATAPSQVGVKQVLSSLVLLTKDGGGTPSLKLISQSGNGQFWRLPSSLVHRFEDDGNVHVVPRGITTITDPRGHVVRRAALNAGSGIILPESFRRYTTPLVGTARAWLPGRYTITTEYRYDGTSDTKTLVTHIWFAGAVLVWLGSLVGLVLLAWGAWWGWVKWRSRRRRADRH